jgi:hypothetical protein
MFDDERAIDEPFRVILQEPTSTSQGAEGSDIVDRLGDKIQNLIWEIKKLLGCFGHGCRERPETQTTGRKRNWEEGQVQHVFYCP